jgi:hypothetical protein
MKQAQSRRNAMFKVKTVVIALSAAGFAMPLAAQAQSNEELLKELRALKARVEQLESQVKEQAAQPKVDPVEFNRIAVKTEALEDNAETSGFKGMKISGFMDPTFIMNGAQRSRTFSFLNNFSNVNGSNEVYTYDNSYFGMLVLDFQKETESGTRWRFTLAPHKSAGGNYNIGSIVHEATVSIPTTDLQTRFWAGQIPDWSGYEYYFANQNKFITHNMLFDFAAATFYTGAGFDITRDKWQVKGMIGNFNTARYASGRQDPTISYRADYSKGEYDGFGFAGQHGSVDGGRLNMFEVDGYFIRGDLTLQGQINFGQWANNAANGGTAKWWGVSALAAYKVTPRIELAARFDYINNKRNGGGLLGQAAGVCTINNRDANGAFDGTTSDVACNDGLNGFGPGMTFVTDANGADGQWEPIDPNRGVNRYALALAANYSFNSSTMLKAEFRMDFASDPAFYYVYSGNYKKTNRVFGLSAVVSF